MKLFSNASVGAAANTLVGMRLPRLTSENVVWDGRQPSVASRNIARIANAVQCQSLLSGNKDCHEFRFSIVGILISGSNVTSLYYCSFRVFPMGGRLAGM